MLNRHSHQEIKYMFKF